MNFYYVYILQCADDSYYTGVTNNLESRLIQHNKGYVQNCYTFKKRPVILKYSVQMNSIEQAILLEKQIKGWSRKKKEALITENWEKLKELSKSTTVSQ